MSGPVPSPSMNGMMGWSGTLSLPLEMVIFAPCAGGVIFGVAAVDIRELLRERGLNGEGRDASRKLCFSGLSLARTGEVGLGRVGAIAWRGLSRKDLAGARCKPSL